MRRKCALSSIKPKTIEIDGRKDNDVYIQTFDTVTCQSKTRCGFAYVSLSSANSFNRRTWCPRWKTFKNTKIKNAKGFNWLVDPCWEKAYVHDNYGNAQLGNMSSLLTAVRSGRKVKVVDLDGFSFEPALVRIRNGHVSAQGKRIVQKNINIIDPLLQTKYTEYSSTGRLQEIVITSKGRGFKAESITNNRTSLAWFVEKRPWEKSGRFNVTNGTYSEGSADAVLQAHAGGKDCRLGMDIGYEIYFNAHPFQTDLYGFAFEYSVITSGDSDFTWDETEAWTHLLVQPLDNSVSVEKWTIPIRGAAQTKETISVPYLDVFTV